MTNTSAVLSEPAALLTPVADLALAAVTVPAGPTATIFPFRNNTAPCSMTSPFPMWMVAPVISTGCSCGGAGISVGCAAAGRIQAMAVTVRAANLNASGDNNFLKFIIYVLTLVIRSEGRRVGKECV